MKLELKQLAPYLPYGLKAKNCFNEISEIKGLQYGNESCGNELWTFIKNKDYLQGYLYECKPILRPLSDLTKEIEHNGDKFVPIIEIAKLYASTNDVEAIKGAVTNFHYFKCYYSKSDYQILIINDGLRGWFSYYFNDDEPNCGVNIVNEWEIREKLFEWHFDVFGLIDKGLAIDINSLISTVEMSTEVQNTTSNQHDVKLPVMRCGDCLFAEGGKTVKFKNGKTNELYDCTLKSRNGNIVLLDSDIRQLVWHNSRACQHFEIMSKTLKKRADLDKEKYHFACDGHFEILP